MLSEDREAIRALKRDFDELAALTETNIDVHMTNEKRMKHYTTVFTAATRNEANADKYLGYSVCETLYNDYQEMLSHFLLSLTKYVDTVSEEQCTGVILHIWKRYKLLMSENIRIFSYLSRFYIVNEHKPSLKSVGLTIFWEVILKKYMSTLVERVIMEIANLVHRMPEALWTPELIECVHLMYSINEERVHFDYEGVFLAPLLVALRDKYASLLTEWVAELGSLALVNQLISAITQAESFFALHFTRSDVQPIMECIEDVFLSSTTTNKVLVCPSTNQHKWGEDDDGVVEHILHKDKVALCNYYLLLRRREHTLTELARLITKAVIINGKTIAQACHINTKENTLTRYIDVLMEMEMYYTTELLSCVDHAPALHKAVCDGLESVFNHVVSINLPQISASNLCVSYNEVECNTGSRNNNSKSETKNVLSAITNDRANREENARESIGVEDIHINDVHDKSHAHLTKAQHAQLLAHYIHEWICKCSNVGWSNNDTPIESNTTENTNKNVPNDLNDVITKVIHLLNYIHDREVFFSVSRDLLAQRILFPLYPFNKDHEQLLVNRLRAQYGSEKTAYLEGILHDYDESVKFNSLSYQLGVSVEDTGKKLENNQCSTSEEQDKEVTETMSKKSQSDRCIIQNTETKSLESHTPLQLSLLAIKKGIWPAWVTTTTHDEWLLPAELSTQLDALRSAYLAKSHDRLLHWALGNSYAEMEYVMSILTDSTTNSCCANDAKSMNVMTLCLSALQALILLAFNSVERCTMAWLSHYLHASNEDLIIALIPLVTFHILSFTSHPSSSLSLGMSLSNAKTLSNKESTSTSELQNDTLSIATIRHKLQCDELLCVSVEAYYAHTLSHASTKIILHPSLLSSAALFDAPDVELSQNKSKYDQSVVLDLTIMKLMKANHTLSHQQLISHCQSEILRHFSVEPHLIKQRIDNLLERGYIVRDRAEHHTYHYQP